jgi:prevent-host-death family protein
VITVNVQQAESQFSTLLKQVERGEEVIISREGRPVARLGSLTKAARLPGFLSADYRIDAAFDEDDDELQQLFDGSLFPRE